METSAADVDSDSGVDSNSDSDANVSIICCYCCSWRAMLLLLLLSLTCLLLSKVPEQREFLFFVVATLLHAQKMNKTDNAPMQTHTCTHSTHTHTLACTHACTPTLPRTAACCVCAVKSCRRA